MRLVVATEIDGTLTDMVAFDTDSKTTVHAKSYNDPDRRPETCGR
jgi:hypothetical protein